MRDNYVIRINKKTIWENICIEYLLLMGLLRGYVEFHRLWQGILIVLFLILLTKQVYRTGVWNYFLRNPYFWLAVLTGATGVLFGSTHQYLFSNAMRLMEGGLIVCMISIINRNKRIDLLKLLRSNFYFLNFFWMTNLIVTAVQCTGNGFLIKSEWLALNPFYPDQCAGLFGYCGTHKLSMFAVFMMLYNLQMAGQMREKYKKRGLYLFTLVTSLFMLYLSTLNDNKTLFFLLPGFCVAFYVFKATEMKLTREQLYIRFIRLLKSAIPFIGVLVIVAICYVNMRDYIQEYVIQSAVRLYTLGSSGRVGSIERITIATDAIREGYGLLFGDGLGAAKFSEGASGNYRGYTHFSMSSAGTLITLGGLWFYLSVCLFYKNVFVQLMNHDDRSWICNLVCLGLIIGLTIYTPFFETAITMLWVCFIFIACGKNKITVNT